MLLVRWAGGGVAREEGRHHSRRGIHVRLQRNGLGGDWVPIVQRVRPSVPQQRKNVLPLALVGLFQLHNDCDGAIGRVADRKNRVCSPRRLARRAAGGSLCPRAHKVERVGLDGPHVTNWNRREVLKGHVQRNIYNSLLGRIRRPVRLVVLLCFIVGRGDLPLLAVRCCGGGGGGWPMMMLLIRRRRRGGLASRGGGWVGVVGDVGSHGARKWRGATAAVIASRSRCRCRRRSSCPPLAFVFGHFARHFVAPLLRVIVVKRAAVACFAIRRVQL